MEVCPRGSVVNKVEWLTARPYGIELSVVYGSRSPGLL